MKRLLVLIIIFIMFVSVVGCTDTSNIGEPDDGDERTVKYITVTGKIGTQTNSKSSIKVQSFSNKVKKVMLFYGRDKYKVTKVKEGVFEIQAHRKFSGGLVFVGEDKSFLGYLKLSDGVDVLPLSSVNENVSEINLGEINFSDKIGTPENNPLEEQIDLSQEEKTLLAQKDDLFASIIKDPDLNNNGKVDLLEEKEIWVRPKIAYSTRSDAVFQQSGERSFTPEIKNNLEIYGFKFDFEFNFPEKPVAINFSGPEGIDITVPEGDIEKDEEEMGVITSRITNPKLPPKGDYTITFKFDNYDNIRYNLTMQESGQSYLVYIVPTVKLDNKENIEKITWECLKADGSKVGDPGDIYSKIDSIQINAPSVDIADEYGDVSGGDERIYNSESLDPSTSEHIMKNDVKWSDVGTIDMAYVDAYGNDFLISFSNPMSKK